MSTVKRGFQINFFQRFFIRFPFYLLMAMTLNTIRYNMILNNIVCLSDAHIVGYLMNIAINGYLSIIIMLLLKKRLG